MTREKIEISLPKGKIIEKIENFVKDRKEIIFAYIFGSFTESKTFKDLDLAIYLDESNTALKKIFYEVELSNQLEEIIRIPVDIIILNSASDAILYRASQGILVKNSDDNTRVSFLTTHWKEYWDFKGKLQEHISEVKHGTR